MEDIKQVWKKRLSLLITIITAIVIYKIIDNIGVVATWFKHLLGVLSPFWVGLLIAYILLIPCKKIEDLFKKSSNKFIKKRARGFSVFITYVLAILIIIIIIGFIFPILKNSIVEIVSNLPSYYDTIVNKFNELPDDSFLKNDMIRNKLTELQNIDFKKMLSLDNEKIVNYARNAISVVKGIFNLVVSIIISIYILMQRSQIMRFLRKFANGIFSKKIYKAVDKYFTRANELFFTFLSSQLIDSIVVGIIITIALLIMKVKYAPLLGFIIGLFNLIPYFGAIIAVIIAIIITLITGGPIKAIVMAIVVTILQQIDANIINPKIVGHNLKVTPLLVIVAVTIGGAYFGVIGMFLGVPIGVLIKEIVYDYVEYKNKQKELKEIEENKQKQKQ